MANLGHKAGIYYVRFRYQGKAYKRSIKSDNRADALAAQRGVEQTIHRLLIGLITLPAGVDAGDFIISGGTLQAGPKVSPQAPPPRQLIERYLVAQKLYLADSTHKLFATHLRHWLRHLGSGADRPANAISHRDLEKYLQSRITATSTTTAGKERRTLLHLFKWAVVQGDLIRSPAADLPVISGGTDRPPFRTMSEITALIGRGGLSDDQSNELWECLFLAPEEISNLLCLVRDNAREPESFLMHAIPAYTGIRRGEVLRLSWLDVNFDDDFVIARSRKQSRTKTFTNRQIDLHPELKEILAKWRQQRPKGQYVLSDSRTLVPIEHDRANRLFWQPLRGTEWCLDSSRNWFKLGFHTYRHSFASNLAAAGVDQRVIDEFMGHSTDAMRRRYRHLFPSAKRSAIEAFSLLGAKKT